MFLPVVFRCACDLPQMLLSVLSGIRDRRRNQSSYHCDVWLIRASQMQNAGTSENDAPTWTQWKSI